MFFNGSRYQRVPDASVLDGEGRSVPLKRTREPVETELALIYQVREGDRLDALANRFFHDPRKWWLIADANPDVLTPEQLLVPGRQLRIPRDRNV
ncbi:MAG: LysM domain-containing protein [Xanthomonadaceae bacterium]|jgi:nucleoid-associated protein YgaU|nr:LysM domain-containing protein [Xanthomonadaceae bacterium]